MKPCCSFNQIDTSIEWLNNMMYFDTLHIFMQYPSMHYWRQCMLFHLKSPGLDSKVCLLACEQCKTELCHCPDRGSAESLRNLWISCTCFKPCKFKHSSANRCKREIILVLECCVRRFLCAHICSAHRKQVLLLLLCLSGQIQTKLCQNDRLGEYP